MTSLALQDGESSQPLPGFSPTKVQTQPSLEAAVSQEEKKKKTKKKGGKKQNQKKLTSHDEYSLPFLEKKSQHQIMQRIHFNTFFFFSNSLLVLEKLSQALSLTLYLTKFMKSNTHFLQSIALLCQNGKVHWNC